MCGRAPRKGQPCPSGGRHEGGMGGAANESVWEMASKSERKKSASLYGPVRYLIKVTSVIFQSRQQSGVEPQRSVCELLRRLRNVRHRRRTPTPGNGVSRRLTSRSGIRYSHATLQSNKHEHTHTNTHTHMHIAREKMCECLTVRSTVSSRLSFSLTDGNECEFDLRRRIRIDCSRAIHPLVDRCLPVELGTGIGSMQRSSSRMQMRGCCSTVAVRVAASRSPSCRYDDRACH